MGPNKAISGPFVGLRSSSASPKIYHVLAETPCPYLAGRWERKLLTEIRGSEAKRHYSLLSRAGFRRSHHFAYRPACDGCQSCVPVRVAAAEFLPSASLRRTARKNADLKISNRPAIASEEQFRVFRSYILSRHGDGEMAAMAFDDYRCMVEQSDLESRLAEFRDPANTLIGACLLDWLEDGPSAVYSFFRPDAAWRGLGNFMVLWLIAEARRKGLPHVYLGYWIRETRKMAYKSRFRPLEALGPNGWQRLEGPNGR